MVRPVSALVLLLALPASAMEPDSEEGVVEEAWALERDPVLRPTHVDPALPGTFADGFAPWAEAVVASAKRLHEKEAVRALNEAFDRAEPIPTAWRAEAERSAAMLDGALAATHRAGARMPPGLRLQAVFGHLSPSELDLVHLAHLATADARLASERGDHAAALRRCADALALSRDMSWGMLLSAIVGSNMGARPMQVCFRLARLAPVGPRREFMNAVERIRAGWGPLSSPFRQERLFGQLLTASRFSDSNRAALPPDLASVVNASQSSEGGLRTWLFGSMARRALFAQMTQLMRASDLAPEEADRIIADVDADTPLSVTLAGLDVAKSSWLKFVQRLRKPRAQLALLHAALAADLYRADHGALPKTWADVFPAGAPVDPRTGRALALDLRADAPAVRAEGDPGRGAEPLSFSLAPP